MIPWAAQTRVLYTGGVLYAPGGPTALLTDGDTIAWVGDDVAALAYRDVADQMVDLSGQFVTPGFVDSHVHATNTGLTLGKVDLRESLSATAVLNRVTSEAQASRGRPIIGHGWDESSWADPTLPTRRDLDRASWGGIVFLSRVDVHAALVSSALVAQCPGIESLPGYLPDGPLTDQALRRVRNALLDSVAGDARRDAQRAFRSHAASHGIVAVHEMATPAFSSADDLSALLALAEAEPGPLVIGYWGEHAREGGIEHARELGAVGVGGDLLVDGSLGSRTACLVDPYSDAPGEAGRLYLDADAVADHLVAAAEAGMQAGFHVIGDGGARAVAAGLHDAVARVGLDRIRAQQHRLEHVTLASESQLTLFAECGIVASVQPCFEEIWGGPGGMYEQRLGVDRALGINPLGSIMRAGIPLALGSDAPVTPLGGWRAVRAAHVHRQTDERISLRAAFAAHTRGAWRALGQHGGVISPGAPAHLAMWDVHGLTEHTPDERIARWSTDPRSGTPALPELTEHLPTCVRTVVAGRTVFERGSA